MAVKLKSHQVDPLQGGILRGMLLFALPLAMNALLQILLTAADTAVIGRFGRPGAIAAIGVCAPAINLTVSGLSGFGTGVTILAGRAFGSGDKKAAGELLHRLPLTAMLAGAAVASVLLPLAEPIERLLNCPESVLPDALDYFRIYFLGLPFSMAFGSMAAMLQSRGNSLTPFLFQAIAGAENLLLNLIFVIAFDLNVKGVAIATVIAQFTSCALVLVYLMRQKDELKLDPRRLTAFQNTAPVFRYGVPAALEGVSLNISSAVIAAAVNRFDSVVIAGNAVATQLEGLTAVVLFAFSGAVVVFISQNLGAGQFGRVRQAHRSAAAFTFLATEIIGIVIVLLGRRVTGLFTPDTAVQDAAAVRMRYMCLYFGLCGTMNVFNGCLRGLGETRIPLGISLIGSVGFRVTWVLTAARAAGTVQAIYVSYPLSWILCSTLSFIAFGFCLRQKLSKARSPG